MAGKKPGREGFKLGMSGEEDIPQEVKKLWVG